MRDCAGLDSSSEDAVELDSGGPGEGLLSASGSGFCSGTSSRSGGLAVDDVIGNEDRRLLGSAPDRADPATPAPVRGDEEPPPMSLSIAVLADMFLDTIGRDDRFNGVPLPLPISVRGAGESLRTDKADAVRRWPRPAESDPGTGEGAAEPFAAAVALRTWARTCEACRSVRYATC